MPRIISGTNLDLYYAVPLKMLVLGESNKNVQFIRKNYGQLGVDIFQSEKKPSILSKKDSKKINIVINGIKKIFGCIGKDDYKETDSLNDVMFKYIYNNKHGEDSDIKNVFGEKGMELFRIFKAQGYVEDCF